LVKKIRALILAWKWERICWACTLLVLRQTSHPSFPKIEFQQHDYVIAGWNAKVVAWISILLEGNDMIWKGDGEFVQEHLIPLIAPNVSSS